MRKWQLLRWEIYNSQRKNDSQSGAKLQTLLLDDKKYMHVDFRREWQFLQNLLSENLDVSTCQQQYNAKPPPQTLPPPIPKKGGLCGMANGSLHQPERWGRPPSTTGTTCNNFPSGNVTSSQKQQLRRDKKAISPCGPKPIQKTAEQRGKQHTCAWAGAAIMGTGALLGARARAEVRPLWAWAGV